MLERQRSRVVGHPGGARSPCRRAARPVVRIPRSRADADAPRARLSRGRHRYGEEESLRTAASAGPRPGAGRRAGGPSRRPVVPATDRPLDTDFERFDIAVGCGIRFLPLRVAELRDVKIHIGHMPAEPHEDGIPRWHIDREARRIILSASPSSAWHNPSGR